MEHRDGVNATHSQKAIKIQSLIKMVLYNHTKTDCTAGISGRYSRFTSLGSSLIEG